MTIPDGRWHGGKEKMGGGDCAREKPEAKGLIRCWWKRVCVGDDDDGQQIWGRNPRRWWTDLEDLLADRSSPPPLLLMTSARMMSIEPQNRFSLSPHSSPHRHTVNENSHYSKTSDIRGRLPERITSLALFPKVTLTPVASNKTSDPIDIKKKAPYCAVFTGRSHNDAWQQEN